MVKVTAACVLKHHNIKVYGGVHVRLHQFLNRTLDGGGQLHTMVTFTPGKGLPRTHRTGGWVGTKVWLESLVKRELSCSCQGLNHSSSTVRPVDQS